eukprot:m51a1_g13143 putative C-tail anchored protein (141) ;mRNA; f:2166-2752
MLSVRTARVSPESPTVPRARDDADGRTVAGSSSRTGASSSRNRSLTGARNKFEDVLRFAGYQQQKRVLPQAWLTETLPRELFLLQNMSFGVDPNFFGGPPRGFLEGLQYIRAFQYPLLGFFVFALVMSWTVFLLKLLQGT